MRAGVLGTGMVGQAWSEKLSALGHEVVIGTRDVDAALSRTEPPRPGMSSFAEWHGANPSVAVGTFAQAAAHGEVLINATSGAGSLDALGAAGPDNLRGKILIDLSNPLDHPVGFRPN